MKIVYIDLDDTMADFSGHPLFGKLPYSEFDVRVMYEPNFFLSLKPTPGALSAVRGLIKLGYDVHILTQPVAESAHSYSEKVQWVGMYFPELVNKIHMTQNKGLFKGDYLIDDRPDKWKDGFEANGGKFIHFDHKRNSADMWNDILTLFIAEKEVFGS